MEVNEEFLEKCITKGLFNDKHFAILVTSAFKYHYFSNDIVSELFKFFKNYVNDYNQLPTKDIFLNSLSENLKEKATEYIENSFNIDVDLSNHYDWLIENTNNYLKDRSIKDAISQSVDVIEENQGTNKIRELVEEALTKDLKMDLGLDYFTHLSDRLKRIFSNAETRIPSGFSTLDNYINGGFPPYTLNIFAAQIHGFKSNTLANIAARNVERGYNVVLVSLEMAEDLYAQRIDSILTKLDINRMYSNTKLQQDLIEKLKSLKGEGERGNLFIKEMPTGKTTVNDIRIYLRELSLRDHKPDMIICDYLNLLKPEQSSQGSYEDKKLVAEDLRSLSFEFNAPVISVTQINREGGFIPLKEIDHNYIAESLAVAATCDSLFIFGENKDDLVYESELHYKIVKNRLGGMTGSIDKMYVDKKSLKQYDAEELDLWMHEAKISGDSRKGKEKN